jgi:alpha-D-ribose 1-methylphosphonate 5-triphosphate synthase subunit PhnG
MLRPLPAAQALLLAGPQEEADLLAALDTTQQPGTAQQSLEGSLLQELRGHLDQLRREQQRRMATTA